jgi:hypothetical protein
MECNTDINIFPKFPDGRTFCPSTITNGLNASNGYHITCKCDSNPNGCIGDIYVYTDALEATRDFFWGRNCKATNVTVNATKI